MNIRFSRRCFLGGAPAACVSFLYGASPVSAKFDDLPKSGALSKAFAPLDEIVLELMNTYQIPGLSLAAAKDGTFAVVRGYGWSDVENRKPVVPRTLFGLASVSKSITAVAVLKLVETGKLSLDDRAFKILEHVKPFPGDAPDPRLGEITIRHLLLHEGGWNRFKSGEPRIRAPKIAMRRGLPEPVTTEDLIRVMMGRPLDFAPGSAAVYSNLGYAIAGLIVEKTTGKGYEQSVQDLVFEPMGLLQANFRLNAHFGEPRPKRMARRYDADGRLVERDGHWEYAMFSGGWLGSPLGLVKFLRALEPSPDRPGFLSANLTSEMLAAPASHLGQRPDGSHFGLGWDSVNATKRGVGYGKGGALEGVFAYIEHTPEGVDWAVLFNGARRPERQPPAILAARKKIREFLLATQPWPDQGIDAQ